MRQTSCIYKSVYTRLLKLLCPIYISDRRRTLPTEENENVHKIQASTHQRAIRHLFSSIREVQDSTRVASVSGMYVT